VGGHYSKQLTVECANCKQENNNNNKKWNRKLGIFKNLYMSSYSNSLSPSQLYFTKVASAVFLSEQVWLYSQEVESCLSFCAKCSVVGRESFLALLPFYGPTSFFFDPSFLIMDLDGVYIRFL